MKKIGLAALVVLSFLFASCEYQSFKDYDYPPYDGAFEWSELTRNAEWENRYGHAAIAYDQKLWVFGGYNPGRMTGDTYLEDVWSSTDGIHWELVVEKAPWLGRRGHRVVVFNDGTGDALFLAGGFTVNEETGYREYANDVWKSTNGKDWIQVKERTYPDLDSSEDWFPRFNHVLVAARQGGTDFLYIIGGASMLENHAAIYAMKYFNDVWRSRDGVHWERLNNNDYGRRSEAGAAVDPETGTIYIQGGVHGVIFETDEPAIHPLPNWHWLWSSVDGENWVPENDTSNFDQGFLWRSDHHLIFYRNTLWGFPGKTVSNAHYTFTSDDHFAFWKRGADQTFLPDSYGTDIDARHGYATAILNDQVFVLGGFTSYMGQSNDVWVGSVKAGGL